MARAASLVLIALLGASCGGKPNPPHDLPAQTTLQRACAWLWQQQADDGGWHSGTYGLMRSGQSLTPFVLHALISAPEADAPRPEGGVARALEFLRSHVNDEGCLGRYDPAISDYPTHATAYAVRCLVAAGDSRDKPLIRRMCAFLRAQQFRPENGHERDSLHYGGWGFGSAGGVMDIAHTRRALQALQEADALDVETAARAQDFLRLVQRHPDEKRQQPLVPTLPQGTRADSFDGGFYFSPVDVAMNKGGFEPANDGREAWFRSYATATCDGLLALLATGVSPEDERVTGATLWLTEDDGLEGPAGIPKDLPTPWYAALHFYHLAVRAEAWAATDHGGGWRKRMERHLAPRQRADCSFINNESPLMKENDALLCTALAVVALAQS